ncbi:MAG: glycosyl hydrolase family 28-related protein [Candidatus Poribacteria bacterium]
MPFRDLEMETGPPVEIGTELLNAGILNVKNFGAVGDGTNDDSSALSSAISSANGLVLIIPHGIYRIGNDVTVSTGTNIWFANDAKISIDSGKKLTIAGTLTAGLHQIFIGSGTADIKKGSCEKIMPQWWGAVGDGSANDTSAIQKAINCALESGNVGRVYLPNGTYKITTALNISNRGIVLQGDGKNQTQILASGGINGINVSETASGSGLEGVILKDFRVYNDTNATGIGINVYAMRHATIDNVWIGGFYDNNIGFEKGIYCETNPAYYLTIQRCILMRNTYGIYLVAGANDTRIDKNDIWYGNYSIYLDGGAAVRVTNNACENYNNNAVYIKDHDAAYVVGNYTESAGKQSGYLTGTTKNCIFRDNVFTSWLYDQNDVQDNSDYPDTNWIETYNIPIRYNDDPTYNKVAGVVSIEGRSKINGDHATIAQESYPSNILMKGVSGDWVFSNDFPNHGVDVQTQFNSRSISTPFGGTGTQFGNLLAYSEDFNSWTKSSVTVTVNQSIAPNGTITADKIEGAGIAISNAITVTAGDVVNFSVWLKSDLEQYALFYLYGNGTEGTIGIKTIKLTNYWKRYSLTTICFGDLTSFVIRIQPDGIGATSYPLYAWGAQVVKYASGSVTGVDNSGVNDKAFLYNSLANFQSLGIDVGGRFQITQTADPNRSSEGVITEINTAIAYSTGTTAKPVVGATITGNNGATAIVVAVTTASGTWAGNNAVGYIEVEKINGAIGSATSWTWTGGSCVPTAVYPYGIIRYDSLYKQTGESSPETVDNGDTYYLAPYYMRMSPPYCQTTGTAIAQVSANFVSPSIATPSLKASLGSDLDTNNQNIKYSASSVADTGKGDVVTLTAGASLVFGDVCYMNSAGKMQKARANAIATSQVMAICLETISSNATGLFLLKGFIHLHTIAPAWTVGNVVYLSAATAGTYTQTIPSATDNCVIKLGIATVADVLYFNPDSTIVVHN